MTEPLVDIVEEPVEEMKPKRRGKGPSAEAKKAELEAKDEYVSPIREDESYPGPHEEPPIGIDDPAALAVMEAALEIFGEDMSPAEKARLEDELGQMQAALDDADGQIEALRQPRGRVQPGLVTKLVEIMAAVDAVEKRGRNDAQKYNYQRATDVFNAVRPEFISRGLLMTMSVENSRTTVIPRPQGGNQILAEIDVEFTVRDTTGEVLTFRGSGAGIDTGDKGIFKAITGAMKYGIRQLLMLPDENDPEKTRTDEVEPQTGPTQINITSAEPQKVMQGGRQQNATSAQIKAIRDVARERMLTAETLAAFISSTLGKGPDISDMDENNAATVVIQYLGTLTFAECGLIVQGLKEAPTNGDT